MARAANPFYYAGDQQLGGDLGKALGTALFGDPDAAAKLALQRAQMDAYGANAAESNAHAGLFNAQTQGVDTQNTASKGLPDLIRGMFPVAVEHPSGPVTPGDQPVGEAPPQPGAVVFDPQTFRNGLPSLMAAMAQMQGDKVDPNKVVGELAAMTGTDEFARRGMVGMGETPGKEFSLTPERADEIAQQGYGANYNKDTAVATINHASDLPVARVQQQTTERGQDIESGDRRRGQNLTFQASTFKSSGGRAGGWTPRFSDGGDNADNVVDGKELVMSQHLGVPIDGHIDRSRLGDVFNAITLTEGPTQNNNPGNIQDGPFARTQPGYVGRDQRGFAVFNSPEAGRQAGVTLLNAKYGNGQQTIRDIIEGTPVAAKAPAKAPKQVSAASDNMLGQLIDAQAKAAGLSLPPNIKQRALTLAAQNFQQSGNPNDAVTKVIGALTKDVARGKTPAPGNINDERARAQAAIARGAPRDQITQLFKQRTGQAL